MALRKSDLEEFRKALEEENETYALLEGYYSEVAQTLLIEFGAAKEAYDII